MEVPDLLQGKFRKFCQSCSSDSVIGPQDPSGRVGGRGCVGIYSRSEAVGLRHRVPDYQLIYIDHNEHVHGFWCIVDGQESGYVVASA